jgi:hypothetical protein
LSKTSKTVSDPNSLRRNQKGPDPARTRPIAILSAVSVFSYFRFVLYGMIWIKTPYSGLFRHNSSVYELTADHSKKLNMRITNYLRKMVILNKNPDFGIYGDWHRLRK